MTALSLQAAVGVHRRLVGAGFQSLDHQSWWAALRGKVGG